MTVIVLICIAIGWGVGITAIYPAKDVMATGDWWFDMAGIVIFVALLSSVTLNLIISLFKSRVERQLAKEKRDGRLEAEKEGSESSSTDVDKPI